MALSLNEERGFFFCHRCHAGGDKVDFIMRVLPTDFRGAMRWLGLEPGKPPKRDPERERQRRRELGLANWAQKTGRTLRRQLLVREQIETHALARLTENPEEDLSWSMLETALKGKDRLEYLLDLLDGDRSENLTAWHILGAGQ